MANKDELRKTISECEVEMERIEEARKQLLQDYRTVCIKLYYAETELARLERDDGV